MSKYEPLTHYLAAQGGRAITLSFTEIEAILGFPLPEKSKLQRAWWSNNGSNNVMTRAWLQAGYRSEKVDVVGGRVTFAPEDTRRGFAEMGEAEFKMDGALGLGALGKRHPLFGSMKGSTIVMPGVDLTAPADGDWGMVFDESHDDRMIVEGLGGKAQ